VAGGKSLCSAPGTTCRSDLCQPCGRAGEPCCYLTQGTSGNGCQSPLRCDPSAGTCTM
jgi:hypothetical protein